MIEELRKIGLSDLEARCYLALHEEPHLSGYEVAKRVSVSRTNVYAVLRALTEQGICRVIEGDPALYDAVPIEELIRTLQSDFEKTSARLLQELKPPPRKTSSFYSWYGEEPLKKAIRRVIANTRKTLIVDIWAEDVHWVEESLLDAERRGISVTLITIGETHSPLRHVLVHQRSEEWNNTASRKFSILSDCTAAIIGSFTSGLKLSALETDHPSVTELLVNAFYHDVVLETIEQDFSRELDAAYGKDYKKILEPYRDFL